MEKSTKENKVKKVATTKKKTTTTAKSKSSTTKTKKTTATKASKTVAKKETTKKANATSSAVKKTIAKKAPTKTTPKKKSSSTKKLDNTSKMKIDILEYYDLPYRYNQTVVKLLFQTPKTLFVYWDITDSDRENYQKQYGEHFFENTKPVLVVHNETKNYTFELEINDFANSWYFNIPDADCKYVIELGRRPKTNEVSIPNDYLYITSSNQLDTPNNRILFENTSGRVLYKNAKTHRLSEKDFGSITYMNNLKHIYSVSEFYHKIYEQELLQDAENRAMKNPTSGMM